jgi:ABC-2 type transport system permease protein
MNADYAVQAHVGPARSSQLRQDIQAIAILWRRELIRFRSDRARAVSSLIQPVLYLFILGTGMSSLVKGQLPPGADFKTFIYPGIITLPVLLTAISAAGSLVWDREFGFLREMLVAPVSSYVIVLGKCLGGATVAMIPGLLMLLLAGFAHVPYSPALLLTLAAELLLLSFAMTAYGLVIAVRIRQIQAFVALTQMMILPLYFLSGALYPLNGLPGWLIILTRLDPLTYAVTPLRHAVFGQLSSVGSAVSGGSLVSKGVTWGGWVVPQALSLGIVAALGCVMLGLAVVTFCRND